MYGKKQSKEHISKRNTPEANEKRSESLRAYRKEHPTVIGEEQRKQMSETLRRKYETGELQNARLGVTGELNPLYGRKRPEHAELMKEKMKGESNGMFGKTHSDETKQLWKDSQRNVGENNGMFGRVGELNPLYGRKRPQEVLDKMKATRERNAKPPLKATCPHCNKTGGANIMKRWHFDNCKFKDAN